MKILAATPVNYSRTKYIVELNSDELAALTTFNGYRDITITDAAGVLKQKDKDKLESGDTVAEDCAKETLEKIRQIIDSKDEINKAFASAKGAMTKVTNALP